MNRQNQNPGLWPAWKELQAAMSQAEEYLIDVSDQLDEIDIADGYRYITRMLRQALEGGIEGAGPTAPQLRFSHQESIKGPGFDNPDQLSAAIGVNADSEYIIRGNKGNIKYLSFITYFGHDYGLTSTSGCSGSLQGIDLICEPDGSFEIIVSAKVQSGNWLPLKSNSLLLVIRQLTVDPENDIVAQASIERIGGSVTPLPYSRIEFEGRLKVVADMMLKSMQRFAGWSKEFSQIPNKFKLMNSERMATVLGDSNYSYIVSGFIIEWNQALVVEITPPKCSYWSLTAYNYWLETFDYRFHNVAVNSANAFVSKNGTIRVVISERDPDLPNWISLAGHRQGALLLRYAMANENPLPNCRLLSFDDLQSIS